MSQIKTLNGVQYTLPQYNDTAWGANTGNVLTQYLAAIADVTLQLSGGAFTLTADADFGANFGLKALYLKSETANPASAGVVRLAKTDSIGWRNNANGADKLLSIDGSDNLQYASTKVLLSGAVVNADINASAAIAYTKLALTGSIVNADINASAAIAYTKLALSASIVNADIATGAAIAYSKLALTGAILNADLAGSIAYSKLVLTGAILNADLAGSIAYSKLTLTNSIVNADINASAAIALSKLAALGTGKALQSNASTGAIEVSAVTNTELGYVSGVTSAIQTQINAISNKYFQAVQVTSSTATNTTSSTFTAATNQSVTITPSSSSHRIKVTVSTTGFADNTAGSMSYTLKRGTTELSGVSNGFGLVGTAVNATQPYSCITFTFIDSPATTSATTYQLFVRSVNNVNTVSVGRADTLSSITAEEIV